jgi:hypothetical protein
MKYLSLTALILLFIIPPKRPSVVDLNKEILDAAYADFVEIKGYIGDSIILFTPVEGYEGYRGTEWIRDDSAIFRPFDRNKEHRARVKYFPAEKNMVSLTGYWPKKGEKVLIVIDKRGPVSLFAYQQGNNYRFWSPWYPLGNVIFKFRKPALKLQNSKGLNDSMSFDGCLLPMNKLTIYGREDQMEVFTGTTMQSGEDAYFIYDFAGSTAFHLDTINKWEAKYLNKHLTVEGILVQYIEGKSVIKNWKILSVKPIPAYNGQ